MRILSFFLLFFVCLNSGTYAVSKHTVKKKTVITTRHHSKKHSKKTIRKTAKKMARKKTEARFAFSESFPYRDFEEQYLDVTRNASVIFDHIRRLNPQVSSSDAHLMASELAIQGFEKQLDPKLVAAVMSVESRFNKRAYHNGAIGLGQLMAHTARTLGVEDPYNITQNVRATTQYIKNQMALYPNSDNQIQLALSCYLLGPGAVSRSGGVFVARVHAYSRSVLSHYQGLQRRYEVYEMPTETTGDLGAATSEIPTPNY